MCATPRVVMFCTPDRIMNSCAENMHEDGLVLSSNILFPTPSPRILARSLALEGLLHCLPRPFCSLFLIIPSVQEAYSSPFASLTHPVFYSSFFVARIHPILSRFIINPYITMGGRCSHTESLPSAEVVLLSHLKNSACAPDTKKPCTIRLITAPTVKIALADVAAPESVEVIGERFGLSDTPRSVLDPSRAHTLSDSGPDVSEHQHSVLRKACDNVKTAAKNCAADNTSASTADIAGDSGNIDVCAIPILSRPSGQCRCRQSSGLLRMARASLPRAERIGDALALLATALGNLILEVYHAWCDNGIMGLIGTWAILIACILDAIWTVVMRVASRAGLVRWVCF